MPPTFDPTSYPALTELPARLRELAGDAAYAAGHIYLRQGVVKQTAVAGTTAFATVTGSTDYRVSVAFADEVKVTCTCPAQRRSNFCKHVVAVCAALLERPGEFAIVESAPDPPAKPRPAKSPRRRGTASETSPDESLIAARRAGLETVDRVIEELADGGMLTLGRDKADLIASAADLVRSLKLRRLGNLTLALQRATGDQHSTAIEPSEFAGLLVDLYLTRRATGTYLEGSSALDPAVAEDLVGKTWRAEELEPIAGLELVEVASRVTSDGEFRVDTSYLVDLPTGAMYAEKQITPVQLRTAPKPRHRQRLLVDQAGLYPGPEPRRIRLGQVRRGSLTLDHVAQLLTHRVQSIAELRQRLATRLQVPFGPVETVVLFQPAALVTDGQQTGALDGAGRFLPLAWPPRWTEDVLPALPPPGHYALCGLVDLRRDGLVLGCLSVVGLRWARGPIYPD